MDFKNIIAGTMLASSMIFTISAFAAPNGNWGKPGEKSVSEGNVMTASCINWTPTGGQLQHPHTQVLVVDENGTPVIGAVVTLTQYVDGEVYLADITGATGLGGSLDGGVDCPDGPTGTGFTRDFCINNAETGYYDAVITNVTMDGYTWDGVTVENGLDHTDHN